MPSVPAHTNRPRRTVILLTALAVLVLLYVMLFPRLREMMAASQQMEREAEAAQAQAKAIQGKKSALEMARARIALNPTNAGAHAAFALAAAEAGIMDEAVQAAEEAARIQPHSVASLRILADISERARRYDRAEAAYRDLIALEPGDAPARVGLGYLYIRLGWSRDALMVLRPAAVPSNPPAQAALALAHIQDENFAAAEKVLLDARRVSPSDPALAGALVQCYLDARRYEDAIRVGEEATSLIPDNVGILNALGEACYKAGKYAAAITALDKVLNIKADDLNARYFRGMTELKTGARAEAIKSLEVVYRQSPGFQGTQKTLGTLYLQSGRVEEGRRLLAESRISESRSQRLTKAVYRAARFPNDAVAHRTTGSAYLEAGDAARAVMELRRAATLAPGDTESHRLLSEALKAAGREGEAAKMPPAS